MLEGVVAVREFCCQYIMVSLTEGSSHLRLLRTFACFECSKALFSNAGKRESDSRSGLSRNRRAGGTVKFECRLERCSVANF